MSYSRLLIHRCTISHLQTGAGVQQYGVTVQAEQSYPPTPNHLDVPSYWTLFNGTQFVQGDGNPSVSETYLVHFKPSQDIRLNDLVVWNGLKFKLGQPRKIRNHHIEVMAVRYGDA